MTQGILLKGAVDLNNRSAFNLDSAVTQSSAPTVACALVRLTFKDRSPQLGDGEHAILLNRQNRPYPGFYTMGAGGSAQGIAGKFRTNLTNLHSSDLLQILSPNEERFMFCRIDFVAGTLKWFGASGQIGETTSLSLGDTYPPESGIQPRIMSTGVADLDLILSEYAFWDNSNDTSGDPDDYVPTETQIALYSAGMDLTSWPTPKCHARPTGEHGTYAETFPDLAGGGDFEHSIYPSGSALSSGDYLPTFYNDETDDVLTDPTATSTARTITFAGATSVQEGELFIVADYDDVLVSPPDPEDIEAGLIQDGVTEALLKAGPIDMTALTNFSVPVVAGKADTAFKAYAVQKYGEGEYSNALEYTISTKRPVLAIADELKGADGSTLASETDIFLEIPNSGGAKIEGLATDAEGVLDPPEIDLSALINDFGAEFDIGDTYSFFLVRDADENIGLRDVEIVDGDA